MSDDWRPTSGYELVKVDGRILVVRRGGKYVKARIPDDEMTLMPVGEAIDYDEGVRIVRALRLTLADPTPQTDPVGDDTPAPTERVFLSCSFCGHWEAGPRTKEQVAEWLRTHKAATLGVDRHGTDRQSTCPHPCGTPMAPVGDDTPAPTWIVNRPADVLSCDGGDRYSFIERDQSGMHPEHFDALAALVRRAGRARRPAMWRSEARWLAALIREDTDNG